MLGVIKTAIITIVISFISGLLLDYYKNLAPRLLCRVGDAIPMNLEGKKVFAYIVTIVNVSNKIIHEITLDIQNRQNNLKIAETKITKGLKFSSSIKDKTLDVNIPFLSKGDKFSVTLYAEGQHAPLSKPAVIVRSPEKFKRIESMEQKGLLFLLLNIPKNITNAVSRPTKKDNSTKTMNKNSYGNKELGGQKKRGTSKPVLNKKALIAMASIALVVIVGLSSRTLFKAKSNNTKTPQIDNTVNKEPTTNSTGGTTKTNGTTKSSSKGTIKNTNTANPSYKSTENNKGTTGSGSSNKIYPGSSTGNTNSNSSYPGSTKNNTGNTNTGNPSSGGSNTGNTNTSNPSSGGGNTGNTNTGSPSSGGGNTENTNTNSSSSNNNNVKGGTSVSN
ncbi:hypothetical protein [uncultured Clostridium sp.]|uniref:hypothetical protein n=1 Tax=uncultured Clostridium sp. TaxID=59620 RepID=UPI0025DC6902|nr:hypothetical protein [uncultured Clostridium sp.]